MDKCKLGRAVWLTLDRLGLPPAAVLRQARLPATLHLQEQAILTTAQLFALWKAIGDLTTDPGFGIQLVETTSTMGHKPAFLAASLAADYRDALSRVARFKRLCAPDQLHFEERDGHFFITQAWPFATEPVPPLLADVSFAMLLEIGRRGIGQHLTPVRMDFARAGPTPDVHQAYFGCPVRYRAPGNVLVLRSADVDRPFPGHNPELLDLLTPALNTALSELQAESSVRAQVKAVLKRGLASGRPEIAHVARELGVSERTLQRRVTQEGSTFRALLHEARQELGHQLLADASMEIEEIAYLLGYQDTNSFYRAFKDWERMTPGRWREIHGVGGAAHTLASNPERGESGARCE
ncbi:MULTISPECIES: AraC family transcriptional regulator [Luteimonas]|uniref:AraC family transcriptional regulator n=1 Tax=Luteimonas TaxID=83614 RepID=UPI0018ED7CE2|nr:MULTISPECIES: AraC family transcriptional regulator [Luteimonas]